MPALVEPGRPFRAEEERRRGRRVGGEAARPAGGDLHPRRARIRRGDGREARPGETNRLAAGNRDRHVPAHGDIASGRDEAVSREQRERVVDGCRPGDPVEVELDPGGHEHEPSEQAHVVPAPVGRVDEAARRARGVERGADRAREERRDADHRAGGGVDLVQLAALAGAAEDVVALAEETDDRL